MEYNSKNLHHMIMNETRESWIDIVKPLMLEEDSSGIILNDNYHYGITLDPLNPNYKCKFNVNDIIYYEDYQWLITSIPLLDNRNSIENIKSRCISAIESGAYLEILRPNSDGVDGKLYLDDEFIYNLSYNDSVTENELTIVSDNEVSKEMIKFKEYMLNPNHRVELIW